MQCCVLVVQYDRRGGVGVGGQVGPQVDGRVAVGGKPVEVADEKFQPQCCCRQQADRRRGAQFGGQHLPQAEACDHPAGEQLHGKQRRQAEAVKVDGQPGLGPDTGRPQPDQHRDPRPDVQVGAGGATVKDAGRQ